MKKLNKKSPPFELRDYQIESSNLRKDFFVKNNRGTLSFPCGTGKTEIMIEVSKKFDLTIILSPLCALRIRWMVLVLAKIKKNFIIKKNKQKNIIY